MKIRTQLGAAIGFLGSFGFAATAAPAALALLVPVALFAQATPGATVHGIAKDPAGQPYASGEIRFSTDKEDPAEKRVFQYKVPLAADGTYKATNVAPGAYIIALYRDGKSLYFHEVDLIKYDDKTVDFDLSSADYIKGLSPAERAILDEAKKKNAAAIAENSKIVNLNKVLVQARADEKGGKADAAVTELTPLTVDRPNEPIIWAALGEAQLAGADAARAAAIAAKTPTSDPAILQKYAGSAVSYQKALGLNAALPKPYPSLAFNCYLNLGQAFARSGKPDEAGAAYEGAAKADPTQAGIAYYNEAAVFYSANKLKEADAAADKAIAADPKRADAYYIKASALIPNATLDPVTKKFVLPPGCLEAYQKYLELDPAGRYSKDIKELLANLGQAQTGAFKAKK